MAFAAIDEGAGELVGVGHIHADDNYACGEYAILLRSDLKGHGLGWELMQRMIQYARSEGLQRIEGQGLRENSVILSMCRELGFHSETDPEEPDVRIVKLPLQ